MKSRAHELIDPIASVGSSRYALIDHYDRYNRHRIFVNIAREYASVLELGCSNGFLSRLIASEQTRVVGIEIDADAAREARRHCSGVYGLDLNHAHWSDAVVERFDLAAFGDVLEHLLDPAKALREARRVLNPGGRVLICLPNVAHWTVRLKLLAGRFDYQSIGIMDHTHLRFFTLPSARRLVAAAGYQVLAFRPVIGGRFTGRGRAVWDGLARVLPGLFAYQMIFVVQPQDVDPDAGQPSNRRASFSAAEPPQ